MVNRRIVAALCAVAVGLTPATAQAVEQSELDRVAREVTAETGIPVGIAIHDATGTRAAGQITDFPAYSTGKVPLAIAALRESPAALADATAAVTVSDNAAADRLWAGLGGRAATAKVNTVLAQGGSTTTNPGWWAMPSWSVADQATFFAHIPCVDKGPEVEELMGNVVGYQRWAFGQLPGAKIKGGWLPDHGYSLRQGAIIPTGAGWVGAAVAVRTPTADFSKAAAAADVAAAKLRPVLESAQPITCAGPVTEATPAPTAPVAWPIPHVVAPAPWAQPAVDWLNGVIDQANLQLRRIM